MDQVTVDLRTDQDQPASSPALKARGREEASEAKALSSPGPTGRRGASGLGHQREAGAPRRVGFGRLCGGEPAELAQAS